MHMILRERLSDFREKKIPNRVKQILHQVNSGAPRARSARERSPIGKFGNLSIRESLVMTAAYDRTLTVQTLGEREGSQESTRRGSSML